jgi:hypothetical protein
MRMSPHKPFGYAAQDRILKAAVLCAALSLGLAGCNVQVQKGVDGDDKNVKVDTPFGGVRVNTDQTTATDLGLPVYPGAQIVRDKDNDKSADIHLGFGQWELRVKAVNYATSDSQDRVTAFYKKALGSYGAVISCRDDKPVGAPPATSEGLTCAEDKSVAKVSVDDSDYGLHKDGLQLKAGSRHHQHIVGFEDSKDGQTRFALVEVELPSSGDASGKSD